VPAADIDAAAVTPLPNGSAKLAVYSHDRSNQMDSYIDELLEQRAYAREAGPDEPDEANGDDMSL